MTASDTADSLTAGAYRASKLKLKRRASIASLYSGGEADSAVQSLGDYQWCTQFQTNNGTVPSVLE